MGLHLALVGPTHITHPFASTLMKQESQWDSRSQWDFDDRIAFQELEKRIQCQQRIRSTMTERKHVHLYEKLTDNTSLPNPCHIVYVVECDPRTLDRSDKNIYHHPNIQLALSEGRQQHLFNPYEFSILLCFNSKIATGWLQSSSRITLPYEPFIVTCWHPQLESNRQEVAESLWKRCQLCHRIASTVSPYLYIKSSSETNQSMDEYNA